MSEIRRWSWLLATACLTACLLACGGSGVGNEGGLVGGPCAENNDCDERCVTGGDFPDGTCTISCDSDADCPGGSYCIDEDGGVCLLGCEVDEDCRDGYNCDGEDNRGHGGDSMVCIAD